MRDTQKKVLFFYSLIMLIRGLAGYLLNDLIVFSSASNFNLYYVDVGIAGMIVLLTGKRTIYNIFLGVSSVINLYLACDYKLKGFSFNLFLPQVGDLILCTDTGLLLLVFLLLYRNKN